MNKRVTLATVKITTVGNSVGVMQNRRFHAVLIPAADLAGFEPGRLLGCKRTTSGIGKTDLNDPQQIY